MEVKNPLKSKTVGVALLTALTGVVSVIVPEVGAKVSEYSGTVLIVLSIAMVILRKWTSGKIGWEE
jgi:hypothetical protein